MQKQYTIIFGDPAELGYRYYIPWNSMVEKHAKFFMEIPWDSM